jgi:hypothetical protein
MAAFRQSISLMIGLISIATMVVSLSLGSSQVAAQPDRTSRNLTWYNCLSREVFTPAKQTWCRRWQILQNATYRVPTSLAANPEYKTVTLSDGRYQEDDQFFVRLVNQQGWLTFGDINGNDRVDAAVILGVALDPNGREIVTYLTALIDIDETAQPLQPVLLGDRILLNGPIQIADQRITVPFLTATEAFNRFYGIEGSALQEFSRTSDDKIDHR